MSAFKSVAVIGAAGTLGAPVTQALLDAGLAVTAITRPSSTSTFPAAVTVKKVDLSSVSALTDALAGIDAVVSTISTPAVDNQKTIVDAAVAAGVKRFIPSEFGINNEQSVGTKIGVLLAAKHSLLAYVKEKAAANAGFTWTGITCGPFFDFCWNLGLFGFNVKDKTATIYDSGNEPFATTHLAGVGNGIVGVLANPAATANRYVAIQIIETTQNELLAELEKQAGAKFTVTRVSSADVLRKADEKLAKGDYSAFIDYLIHWTFADGGNHVNKKGVLINEDIGLKQLSVKDALKLVL